jgi:hypothetical protein
MYVYVSFPHICYYVHELFSVLAHVERFGWALNPTLNQKNSPGWDFQSMSYLRMGIGGPAPWVACRPHVKTLQDVRTHRI